MVARAVVPYGPRFVSATALIDNYGTIIRRLKRFPDTDEAPKCEQSAFFGFLLISSGEKLLGCEKVAGNGREKRIERTNFVFFAVKSLDEATQGTKNPFATKAFVGMARGKDLIVLDKGRKLRDEFGSA